MTITMSRLPNPASTRGNRLRISFLGVLRDRHSRIVEDETIPEGVPVVAFAGDMTTFPRENEKRTIDRNIA
jgi:hypothetical protein